VASGGYAESDYRRRRCDGGQMEVCHGGISTGCVLEIVAPKSIEAADLLLAKAVLDRQRTQIVLHLLRRADRASSRTAGRN
jgi:hypothetical protein